jgi:hypothetical protein
MALVVPNSGDLLMLQYVIGQIDLEGNPTPVGNERILHLFTNNYVPEKVTEIDDLTEASEDGYATLTLNGDDWTVETVPTNVNRAIYAEQIFTFTEAVTVYGYFVTTSDGDLLWAERLSNGPYTLPAGGGQIGVTPKLTFN